MKRFEKILLIAVCVVASFATTQAETISQKAASRIAETFFNAAYGEVSAPPKLVWNGRQLTTDRLFSPFYIYNHPKGGFVIISAENKAFPILGYSLKYPFDRSSLGDDENALIKKYAREIELIRYDSRVPERAIEAWGNIASYIDGVVKNPYASPEYRILPEEKKELLETIDRRNGWIVMPSAVEFDIYDADDWREPTLEDYLGEEEIPFSFYEQFLSDIAKEEKVREAALEEILNPSEPVISYIGGGRISVSLPDNVRMARVYALDGSLKYEKYYKDTNTASLDLSALPNGYYVMMLLSDSGNIFGKKISR